jgi:hypothetical protein
VNGALIEENYDENAAWFGVGSRKAHRFSVDHFLP